MTDRVDGVNGSAADVIGRRSFLAALAVGTTAAFAACSTGRAEESGAGSDARRGEGGAAAGSATASGGSEGGPGASPFDRWGVQLYTLRDRIEDDLDATLAAVAAVGYAEVELFQLHGLTPAAMRSRLDAVGLRATSSHYPLQAFRGELEQSVDTAAALGQSLMVLPSIPSEVRTAEGLARVADDLSRAGERAAAAGIRVGYHNHDWELRPMADGTRPIDLLLDRSDPALVDWQMDIFWTVHGGADPLTMLAERGDRVSSVHVKDRTADGEMVDVGDGVIDFANILVDAAARALRHAYVEHDQPGDSVESVRRSYGHLTALNLEAVP